MKGKKSINQDSEMPPILEKQTSQGANNPAQVFDSQTQIKFYATVRLYNYEKKNRHKFQPPDLRVKKQPFDATKIDNFDPQ